VNITVHLIGLVSVNACLKYREGCKINQVKEENFGCTGFHLAKGDAACFFEG
jgi:hypothetical protein